MENILRGDARHFVTKDTRNTKPGQWPEERLNMYLLNIMISWNVWRISRKHYKSHPDDLGTQPHVILYLV